MVCDCFFTMMGLNRDVPMERFLEMTVSYLILYDKTDPEYKDAKVTPITSFQLSFECGDAATEQSPLT